MDDLKNSETATEPKKKAKEVIEAPKLIRGRVYSRLNHPVELVYGREHFMLAPKGKTKVLEDMSLVGELPMGCEVLLETEK